MSDSFRSKERTFLFDDVCCVNVIISRLDWENTHYLNSMKALFGADGGLSLWFEDYIEN